MTTFISFGCWNYDGCKDGSGFKQVSEAIIDKQTRQQINFFIINGDNYYQEKLNDKQNHVDKTVDEANLVRGFNCLKSMTRSKELFLLMGNHDVDRTNDCETIRLEKDFVSRNPKIHLPTNLVMFKTIGSDTLIIMLDSTIYTSDYFIECYEKLTDYKDIDKNNHSFLVDKQKEVVQNELAGKHYKNIIVCAHHPLMGIKNQVIKESKGKIKQKGGIDSLDYDMYALLYDVIKPYGDEFFYLCADIHNYQKGEVLITKNGESMKISQYIVGTGGAKLDPDYNGNYHDSTNPLGTDDPPPKNTFSLSLSDIDITYNLADHWSDFGYLITTVHADTSITFEAIRLAVSGGSNRKFLTRKPTTTNKYKQPTRRNKSTKRRIPRRTTRRRQRRKTRRRQRGRT